MFSCLEPEPKKSGVLVPLAFTGQPAEYRKALGNRQASPWDVQESANVLSARTMPKVIFFDAVGTLIYLPDSVGTHYASVAGLHGVSVSAEELDTAFGQAWKSMPVRTPTRQARRDDDRGWWRELVERTFALAGAIPGDFNACFDALYARFAEPGVWALYPDVRPTLERLAASARLAVLSNFDTRLRGVLAQLEVADWFESITVSSETGADKPHPEIFEAALATMGVAPRDALHVGDHPSLDWQAAEAVGMQVFRLDRPRNSLADLRV
jgi:putative hydrolase of the HAD superfamily